MIKPVVLKTLRVDLIQLWNGKEFKLRAVDAEIYALYQLENTDWFKWCAEHYLQVNAKAFKDYQFDCYIVRVYAEMSPELETLWRLIWHSNDEHLKVEI